MKINSNQITGLFLLFLIISLISFNVLFKIYPSQQILFLSIVILIIYVALLSSYNLFYVLILWLFTIPFSKFIHLSDLAIANLRFDRIILIILLLSYLLKFALDKQAIFRKRKLDILIILFIIYVFVSLIFLGHFHRFYIADFINIYVGPFLGYWLAKNLVNTHRQIHILLTITFVFSVYLGILSIFESMKIESLIIPRYILNPELGIHFNTGRIRGPFCDAEEYGTVLGMLIPITIIFIDFNKTLFKKILILFVIILLFIGVYNTFTRAAWLGSIIGVLILFIFQRRYKMLLISLSFIIGLSIIISNSASSNKGHTIERIYTKGPVFDRLQLWNMGLHMFKDNPIWGVGFGMFPEKVTMYNTNLNIVPTKFKNNPFIREGTVAHNLPLTILGELGLIGFMMYLSIIISMLRIMKKLYYISSQNLRKIIITFFSVWIVLFVNAQFYTMVSLFALSFIFILAGISSGLYYKYIGEQRKNFHEKFKRTN